MKNTVAALLLSVCVAARAGRAQELLAGWEGGGSQGFAFARGIFPFAGSPRHALVVIATGSYLWYGYPDSVGSVEVRAPGAGMGVGYRWNGQRVFGTLAVGYLERPTTERPAGGGLALWTLERGGTVDGDLYLEITPHTAVNAIVNYETASRYSWVRAGVRDLVAGLDSLAPLSLALGVEGTVQGNRDVRAYQAGPVIEVGLPRAGLFLEFRLGYMWLRYVGEPGEFSSYFGVLLDREF